MIEPVTDPHAQLLYWVTQGILTHTNMTHDEAQRSAAELIRQCETGAGQNFRAPDPARAN